MLIQGFVFFIENILSCIIYFIPLKEKKIRLWGIIPIALFYSILILILNRIPSAEDSIIFSGVNYLLLFIATNILFFRFFTSLRFSAVIFYSVCAKATQHFASSLHIFFWSGSNNSWISEDYIPVYVLTYLLFYFFFSKDLSKHQIIRIKLKTSISSILIVLPLTIILSLVIQKFTFTKNLTLTYKTVQIYAMVTTFFLLWVFKSQIKEDSMSRELHLEKQLREEQLNKYRMSKENIEWLNRKYHDLKHQLNALNRLPNEEKEEFIDKIGDSLDIYDISIKTGNEVLDTILFENRIHSTRHNINWHIMVKGDDLGFIETLDLYTLLGNAISNSVEAVSMLSDSSDKSIDIVSRKQGNILIFQISNSYNYSLKFNDGFPVTTKDDSKEHGYGLKSIKSIVTKYGGDLVIKSNNYIFTLQLIFPGITNYA